MEASLNYTIGSALDLFGGSMKFEDVLEFGKKNLNAE